MNQLPEEKHLEMEKAESGGALEAEQEILSALAVEDAHSLRAMLAIFSFFLTHSQSFSILCFCYLLREIGPV